MPGLHQTPPFLITRATGLLLARRVHFPKDRIGEVVEHHGAEDFIVFRQVVVDPPRGQYQRPRATLKVRFHFRNFSPRVNKILSLIPIPFIIAQPGFRSKTWMLGRETGMFQGVYEWETTEDADNYWTSFPLNLMKKRAIPESLIYTVSGIETSQASALPGAATFQ